MRLDLQGMRAFAVLAVFADHLFGWPHGGFVGVDVFFVLSGFFITGLLISERTHAGKISFRNFYVRRVRRIIPSAVLVIVVTVVASSLLLTATRAKDALIDGLWAAIFLSNWRFERVGTDYFAQGTPDSPLLHYWSLSIEEQFYFVWPLLLLGLFALTRRYSKPGKRYPARRQLWIASFMACICTASFVWACVQFVPNPAGAYFSTLTRVWELGVGALLAIGAPMLARIPGPIRPALSYIGFAGAASSLFVVTPEVAFPGPWAALPVLSTALVIAAFVGGEVRAVPHLTNRVAQYFGEVSYTLYLWHWPVIILLAAILPTDFLYYLAVVALAMGLTAVTYHFYENPIRRSSWLDENVRVPLITPSAWAAVGALVVTACLIAALSTEISESRSSDAQQNQTLIVDTVAPTLDQKSADQRCRGAAAWTTPGCVLYDPEKPLMPEIDRFAEDAQGAYECYREAGDPLETCTYGYTKPDGKQIAVVGDSHAAMLLPALSPYLIANKWSLTTFVGNGCQWINRPAGDCVEPMKQIQAQLLDEPFDLVITTASRAHEGNGIRGRHYAESWEPVVKANSKILVVADVPGFPAESLDCLTRVGSDPGGCSTPRSVALSDVDPLPDAAQMLNVGLLDMTDSFCNADSCPAIIGNVIVYRDSAGHISATFAKSLSSRLIAAIKAQIG